MLGNPLAGLTARPLPKGEVMPGYRIESETRDVFISLRLGISPQSLMKNSSSPSQPWKVPVKEWIHQIYAKRFGRHPPVRDPGRTIAQRTTVEIIVPIV